MKLVEKGFHTKKKGMESMNTKQKMTVVSMLLLLTAVNSFGGSPSSKDNRGHHQGPPPEAYTACEDKNAGDKAEFVNPRGDTVTGTCEMEGDRLVLRPEKPPEAYTACEDKNAGDKAEFVSPRGDKVTGTCEEEDGQLVLRPDNQPQKGHGRNERDNSNNE